MNADLTGESAGGWPWSRVTWRVAQVKELSRRRLRGTNSITVGRNSIDRGCHSKAHSKWRGQLSRRALVEKVQPFMEQFPAGCGGGLHANLT
jgi:hypothetical protein